jgi:glycosyltransferase involved in cell wall biosynthesis
VPDPRSYDDYILGSDAECSAAQGMYVVTNSGWFSDRTVRYLAAGKPALVQDTGFSRRYPVGEGLIAFRTVEEAARGVDAIQSNPRRHQQAARALAAEFFDSNAVIGRLLDEAGVAA